MAALQTQVAEIATQANAAAPEALQNVMTVVNQIPQSAAIPALLPAAADEEGPE